MGRDDIYISRQVAEEVETALSQAIAAPQVHPVLFHIYGIGGVGKSRLTRHLIAKYGEQAAFTKVSFGETEGINDPISLMEKLFNELEQQFPKPHLLQRDVRQVFFPKPDPFAKLYQQYFDTKYELETTAPDGKQVDPKQIETVKKWTGRIAGVGSSLLMSGTGVGGLLAGGTAIGTSQMAEKGVDVIAEGLSLKDEMQRLLREHKATKQKRELQELMLDPIPKLTEAFVESTAQRERTVVLVLDTLEKVPLEVNEWLWRSLLANTDIAQQPIRVVTAGRYKLTRGENWRKLKQDRNCFEEYGLDRFDETQTQAYLQQFDPELPVDQIYQTTRGLPYYLNWIREQRTKGRDLDFSQGNQEIAKLLLQGLNATQEKVVQLAASCRWFDERMLKTLVEAEALEFDSAVDTQQNCYDWLSRLDFVEYVQGRYRLDDVARDVFREALYQRDEEGFETVHQRLADEFERRANRKVPDDAHWEEKYNDSEWRECIAEKLYHLAFASQKGFLKQFTNHFLEECYFYQGDICESCLTSITAENELENHPLLSSKNRNYLIQIKSAVDATASILEKIREDDSLQIVFASLLTHFDHYSALGQFVAILIQMKMATKTQLSGKIERIFELGATITKNATLNFGAELYSDKLGNTFFNLNEYEKALESFNRALELQPNHFQSWNNKGTVLYDSKKYKEALESFNRALELQPDEPLILCNQGNALRALGDYKAAIACYENALKVKPDCADSLNKKGNTFVELSEYKKAISCYNYALEIEPDNSEAWFNKGTVLVANLDSYEEAINSFDHALEIKPNFYEAWHNRGQALRLLNYHEKAVSSFNRALEIQPDNHNALTLRGSSWFELGEYEEAILSFNRALEIQPDDYHVLASTAATLLLLGKHEEAIVGFNRALETQPDNCEAWHARGEALYESGKYEEAIVSFNRALDIQPDNCQAWYTRGEALYESGKYEEAIVSFNCALDIQPDNHHILTRKAATLLLQGKHEEALSSFDHALSIQHSNDAIYNAAVWGLRGTTLADLGRHKEAINSYDRALEIQDDEQPNEHDLWLNRGLSLGKLGKYKAAVASFDCAITVQSDNNQSWCNRGVALRRLGRYEDAIASYDRAIEIRADDYHTWSNKGAALCDDLQQYEEALATFDKAIEIKPDYHIAWYNHGNALRKLGRYEDAISSYDQAIKLNPDFPSPYYNKACCYGFQYNLHDALANLQHAVNLDPKCRDMAKTDSNFDPIRHEPAFQRLLGD